MNARAGLAGVNLTEQQKTSLKAINKKYADQMKTLRADEPKSGAAPDPQRRQKVQQLVQQEQADVRNMLTTAQRTQYDANLKKGRGRGHGKQIKKPINP